jgi:hypothetical protein
LLVGETEEVVPELVVPELVVAETIVPAVDGAPEQFVPACDPGPLLEPEPAMPPPLPVPVFTIWTAIDSTAQVSVTRTKQKDRLPGMAGDVCCPGMDRAQHQFGSVFCSFAEFGYEIALVGEIAAPDERGVTDLDDLRAFFFLLKR